MSHEHETRICNIDREGIRQTLIDLGAVQTQNVLQRRVTFDFPDRRFDAINAFVRLRDNGQGAITLAYKQNPLSQASGVGLSEEIEFHVPDWNTPIAFLLALGLEQKQLIETKRESYRLDDISFDVDEWPLLPPFIEIEGPNQEQVERGVQLLGFTLADTFQGDAGAMYDRAGIDWKAMKEIRF